MKAIFTFLFLALISASYSQKVRIATAANMRFAMEEILAEYKKDNPGVDIEVIFGSSGNFYAQIVNGAPFDIFFSADLFYPQKLNQEGYTLGDMSVYAIGRLVLWSSSVDVSSGVQVLNDYPRARVALANPELAPYGQRAAEALKYYGMYDKVKSQFILAENISQAAQFCLSGNAQFGFIALSLALSPTMRSVGNYYIVNDDVHGSLEQAYVFLKRAKDNSFAQAFAKYVSSPQAIEIFERYGYVLP